MNDKRKYTTVLIEKDEVLNLRLLSEVIADKIRREGLKKCNNTQTF